MRINTIFPSTHNSSQGHRYLEFSEKIESSSLQKKEEISSILKKGKQFQLSSEDIQRIEELNTTITTVPQHIIQSSLRDVVKTLTNGNPMNRIIRGEDGQINAYLACDTYDKQVHIKYAFSNGENIKNLKKEIEKFISRARKLGYESIIFNGLNEKLAHFLEKFGFEEQHDTQKTYKLNLSIPSDPLLQDQLNYLETDANASEIWASLSSENKEHITTLLRRYNDLQKDPQIYNLYGALEILITNNIDISLENFRTLDQLYKKAKEIHTMNVKKRQR